MHFYYGMQGLKFFLKVFTELHKNNCIARRFVLYSNRKIGNVCGKVRKIILNYKFSKAGCRENINDKYYVQLTG